jgi:hypothetical protein
MSSSPDDRPFSESNLESAEYRQRLSRKLNCLIAVLEVAITKVRHSLGGPDPDLERLERIQKNLNGTLDVCRRARTALDRHEDLPSDLSESLAKVVGKDEVRRLPVGDEPRRGMAVEMSSAEELERFRSLEPIDRSSVQRVDFEELAKLLQRE